jgi:putative transposase
MQWTFFVKHLWHATDEYFIAGDEVVVSKAGRKTHARLRERFFSGVQQQVIPGLSFFALS